MKAVYNGVVLAESDKTQMVEGNHYFPPESVNRAYFRESDLHTVCPWKGRASYYDVVVADQKLGNAAWYYPEPSPAATHIVDHVAFYGMVEIES